MDLSSPIPCPSCGYDLRGLVGPIGAACPECGTAHARHELAQHRTRILHRRFSALAAAPLIMILTGSATWFVAPVFGLWDLCAVLLVPALAGFLWNWFAQRRAQAEDPSSPQPPIAITLVKVALFTIVTGAIAFVITTAMLLVGFWFSY